MEHNNIQSAVEKYAKIRDQAVANGESVHTEPNISAWREMARSCGILDKNLKDFGHNWERGTDDYDDNQGGMDVQSGVNVIQFQLDQQLKWEREEEEIRAHQEAEAIRRAALTSEQREEEDRLERRRLHDHHKTMAGYRMQHWAFMLKIKTAQTMRENIRQALDQAGVHYEKLWGYNRSGVSLRIQGEDNIQAASNVLVSLGLPELKSPGWEVTYQWSPKDARFQLDGDLIVTEDEDARHILELGDPRTLWNRLSLGVPGRERIDRIREKMRAHETLDMDYMDLAYQYEEAEGRWSGLPAH